MSLTVRAASNGFSTSGGAALAITLPTGWQPGDFIMVTGFVVSTTPSTWSQTSGTGTWTLADSGESVATSGGVQSFAASISATSALTAPTFTCTHSGRFVWVAVALTPDSGQTAFVDTQAADLITTTGTTSFTANPATANGAGEVSVILSALAATAQGASTLTYTKPTAWTVPANGSRSVTGGASTYSMCGAIACQTGVSGTVTPTAETSGISCIGVVYHALIREAVPGTAAAITGGTSTPSGVKNATGSSAITGGTTPAVSSAKAVSGTTRIPAAGTPAPAAVRHASGSSAAAGAGTNAPAASRNAPGTASVTTMPAAAGAGIKTAVAAVGLAVAGTTAGTGLRASSGTGAVTLATGAQQPAGAKATGGDSSATAQGLPAAAGTRAAPGSSALDATALYPAAGAKAAPGTARLATAAVHAPAGVRDAPGTSRLAVAGLLTDSGIGRLIGPGVVTAADYALCAVTASDTQAGGTAAADWQPAAVIAADWQP